MTSEFEANFRGVTLDSGRIVVVQSIDGGWRGRQRGGRDVLVVFRDMRIHPKLEELLRYEVPGLAKLAFFGHPDVGDEVAIAEEEPDGDTLAHVGTLSEFETIQLGIDLCELALAWAARRDELTIGLRPETVYLAGVAGARRFSGATPRTELLRSGETDPFEAPTQGYSSYTADDIGFLVARILWIALLGEDPYKFAGHLNDYDNIWHDRRANWTGPPELGRLLEQVLVVQNRLPVTKFRDALRELQAGL